MPGEAALDLATGRLRQRRLRYQGNGLDGYLMLPYDRLANCPGDRIDIQVPSVGSLDLLHHRKLFVAIRAGDVERGSAVPAQRRMTVLDGSLDVLRVVVHTANDDHVLDPARDEQLAALVKEPQIAGA